MCKTVKNNVIFICWKRVKTKDTLEKIDPISIELLSN